MRVGSVRFRSSACLRFPLSAHFKHLNRAIRRLTPSGNTRRVRLRQSGLSGRWCRGHDRARADLLTVAARAGDGPWNYALEATKTRRRSGRRAGLAVRSRPEHRALSAPSAQPLLPGELVRGAPRGRVPRGGDSGCANHPVARSERTMVFSSGRPSSGAARQDGIVRDRARRTRISGGFGAPAVLSADFPVKAPGC